MEQLNGAVKEDGTKEQLRRIYAVNALRNGSMYSKCGRLCADDPRVLWQAGYARSLCDTPGG